MQNVEREKEFQRIHADVENNISQVNEINAKLKSQITNERLSHAELKAEYSEEIKTLKSSIKTLKNAVSSAHCAEGLIFERF